MSGLESESLHGVYAFMYMVCASLFLCSCSGRSSLAFRVQALVSVMFRV